MSGNILWKFLLTGVIIFWCVMSITPLQDRPFEDYIVAQVTAEEAEFADLLQRAETRVDAKESPTLFIALRDLGRRRGDRLRKVFPADQRRRCG
jgi:SecD/SecF fusion protein